MIHVYNNVIMEGIYKALFSLPAVNDIIPLKCVLGSPVRHVTLPCYPANIFNCLL